MTYIVDLSPIKKDLRKVPFYIADKVQIWADQIEKEGLFKVQQVPGDRKGQRSVYLNKQWRLIYTTNRQTNELTIVSVEEVTPHAY